MPKCRLGLHASHDDDDDDDDDGGHDVVCVACTTKSHEKGMRLYVSRF